MHRRVLSLLMGTRSPRTSSSVRTQNVGGALGDCQPLHVLAVHLCGGRAVPPIPVQVVCAKANRGLHLRHHLAVQVHLLGQRDAREFLADGDARVEGGERGRPQLALEAEVATHEGRIGFCLELGPLIGPLGAEAGELLAPRHRLGKPRKQVVVWPWLLRRVVALELHGVGPRALGAEEWQHQSACVPHRLWLDRPLGVAALAMSQRGRLAKAVEPA
eukprot:scaffold201302_cov30-Tisochrysis_lutea.AAC.2